MQHIVWDGQLSEVQTQLYALEALQDNYIYVFVYESKAIVIDPGESKQVLELAHELHLDLTTIFLTHHHEDHTAGVAEIRNQYPITLLAPDDERIHEVDQQLIPADELIMGPFLIQVFATPGHTAEHVSLYFPQANLLFPGDTLFCAGCGKIFESSAEQLFQSLESFKALPKNTLIFPAHEYTVANLHFALSVEPENKETKRRLEDAIKLRNQGLPTVPCTLEEELMTNPFLRTSSKEIRKRLDMMQASDLEVFAKLRYEKDHFTPPVHLP